jgi:hypothetical protein
MSAPISQRILLISLSALLACGGGGGGSVSSKGSTSSTPAASVSVAPANVTLSSGGSQTFTAALSNASGSIQWSATGGSINGSGQYTAPTNAGTYTVRAALASDPKTFGEAQVVVQASTTQTLSVTPGSVTLGPGAAQSFTATLNPGGTHPAVHWSVSSGSIDVNGNFTAPNDPGAYAVRAELSSNASVSGTAQVTVQSSGSGDSTPPSIQFTSPADGATVSGIVAVSCNSLDNVSTSQIELYVNGQLLDLGRDGRPPESPSGTTTTFNFNTLLMSNGAQTLRAVAVDTSGNRSEALLHLNVANPLSDPSGSMTPATATVKAGGSVDLTAVHVPNLQVCDCDSFYRRMIVCTGGTVELSADDPATQTIHVLFRAPRTPGTYRVRVGSLDTPTHFLESTITVVADLTAPVITFTAPSGTLSGIVPIHATATDDSGTVQGMQFLLDGKAWGSVGQPGLASMDLPLNTRLVSNGAHTLAVKAWDLAGNQTTTSAATIQIQNAATGPRDRAFEAPAQTSGQITVKLYPTEIVAPGAPRLVTFGMPFPRGSVTAADLSKVRVLKGGSEIAAHVELLTPWRHLSDAAKDGTSVRVARIQIQNTFSVDNRSNPAVFASEPITVEWGMHTRSLDVATLQDPRTGWHTANSGSYLAADGVSEPDVYAVLPSDWLCQGILKPGRMLPMQASIPETRMDPVGVAAEAEHPGGFRVQDLHVHNWFYTLLNQDDPRVVDANQIHYKAPGDYEPWLYDRASAMYVDYFRSGMLKPLREAVRAAEFYGSKLDANGFFTINTDNPQDPKYSYAECLAYTYWLTGDSTKLDPMGRVLHAFDDYELRWSTRLNFWTERHTGFRLLAYAIHYEVAGDAFSKTTLLTDVASLEWHQNGADGRIPSAGRIDGGLYHLGDQHAGDAEAWEFVASPWMSILVVDPMIRVYGVSGASDVASFIRRMGTFEKAGVKITNHYLDDPGGLAQPDYMTRYTGDTSAVDDGNCEHTPEGAAVLAWAGYFAELQGQPDPTLYQAATDCYYSYEANVRNWTRPAAPPLGYSAYRVAPARKYGWQVRTTNALGWLMP